MSQQPTMSRSEAFEALSQRLGPEGFTRDADETAAHGSDRSHGPWPIAPSALARPKSIADVQAIVRMCARAGLPIVPSGGRTGLSGGAVATGGELVVSFDRMRAIGDVDVAARRVRCEAGATIASVHAAAAAHGLRFPVDWAATGTAQVGGAIATNAGGVRVLAHGMMRRWVCGLRVVVASGEVLDLDRGLIKDNTGYDLGALFVGSEGTLGFVVEATLGLLPRPLGTVVALVALEDDARAVALLTRLQLGATPVSAFEVFDDDSLRHVLSRRGQGAGGPFAAPASRYALIELEVASDPLDPRRAEDRMHAAAVKLEAALTAAVEHDVVLDAQVAQTDAQGRALWALREEISESLHPHRPHKADVAVPVSALPAFTTAWRALVDDHMHAHPAVCFGHYGDGNVHLNVLCPKGADLPAFERALGPYDEALYALVAAHGGTISAEHGVGLLKRDHLHVRRTPAELALMRAVKAALDPQGLFNPGKIFTL